MGLPGPDGGRGLFESDIKTPRFSSGHLEMRNAGTQLRSRNAALIPPKGVVLGAIDPAIDAAWANPKRNPANTPGRAHQFYQRCGRCRENSEII